MDQKILFQLKKFNKNHQLKRFDNSSCVLFTDLNRINNLEKTINKLPKNSIIILREYNLNQQKKQVLAEKVQKICKKNKHKLIIGKDLKLAKKIKADGIHFSDLEKTSWREINKKSNFAKSFACHSKKSIIKAQKSKADILFLSPIFATNSHKNAKTLGSRKFRDYSKNNNKIIFALGGINETNIKEIIKLKINGFGGIDVFN